MTLDKYHAGRQPLCSSGLSFALGLLGPPKTDREREAAAEWKNGRMEHDLLPAVKRDDGRQARPITRRTKRSSGGQSGGDLTGLVFFANPRICALLGNDSAWPPWSKKSEAMALSGRQSANRTLDRRPGLGCQRSKMFVFVCNLQMERTQRLTLLRSLDISKVNRAFDQPSHMLQWRRWNRGGRHAC